MVTPLKSEGLKYLKPENKKHDFSLKKSIFFPIPPVRKN